MTAKSLKHKFVSAVADGTDATLVRSSNWNDEHNLYLGYRAGGVTPDTIVDGDHLSLIVYGSGSPVTVNIAAPSGVLFALGWKCTVRNTAAGVITITGTGGATINGQPTLALNQGDTVELRSIGTPDFTGIAILSSAAFLKPNATATISVGYTFTPNNLGNIATPFTPNPALGNYQYGMNNGAITFNAPASDCAMDILVTNSATAGAITFSGYTVGTTGDPLTTTNGQRFIISIRRINAISTYAVKALQ